MATKTRAGNTAVRVSRVPMFKGADGSRRSQNMLAESAPARLSLTTRKEILKQLGVPPTPGSVYVSLSASQAGVTNKGALLFIDPDLVEGGEGYALWSGNKGHAELWLKSPAGRSYLIECGVSRPKQDDELPGGNFSIAGPDGTSHQYILTSWGDWLVFYFNASSNGWYRFTITTQTPPWRLLDCEVTHV